MSTIVTPAAESSDSPVAFPHSPGFDTIIRNIIALSAAQAITMVTSGLVAVLQPRFLGDIYLGKLAFATSFAAYFGLASSLGISTYLAKEVARDPSKAITYAFNAILLRLPLSALVSVVGILIVKVSINDSLTRDVIYISFLGMILGNLYGIIGGILQGLQKMGSGAIAQTALRVVGAASVSVLLITGYGIREIAWAGSLSVGVGLVIGIIVLSQHVTWSFKVQRSLWKGLLIGGTPYLLWQISLLIYGQTDMLMLSFMTGDAVVGWYAAAYGIISIPWFIPTIITTAAFPALTAAAAKRDVDTFNTIARRGLQSVLILTVPMAAGLILVSQNLIDTFGYSGEFQHSVPLIMILGLHIPLTGIDMIIGTALNAHDRQREWALTGVAAAFLNPAMNAALIPLTQAAYGNGAIGSSVATVITEVFMMVMGLRLLPHNVFDRLTISIGIRCAGAALLMSALVWPVRGLPLAIPIAIGIIAYCALCFGLRVVTAGDIRQAGAYLQSRRQERIAEAN